MVCNIVVLDGYTLNPGDFEWDDLEALGNVSIYDQTNKDQIIERSINADILLVNKVKLTKEIIEALPNLKYISLMATGFDNVDIAFAKSMNIVVSNVSDYSTPAVAQNVFAHLLNIINRTAFYSAEVSQGIWSKQENFSYWYDPITDLKGKVIGLVGFGKIAKEVAQIALAFGMKVIFHNRSHVSMLNCEQVSLDDLYRNADYVSLHVPYSEETHHMINAESLNKMKNGAVLINTARGALIHDEDLLNALNSNKLAAAGLDVLSQEPPPQDHILIGASNCYITPHQAWSSLESRKLLFSKLLENVKAFLNDEPIRVIA